MSIYPETITFTKHVTCGCGATFSHLCDCGIFTWWYSPDLKSRGTQEEFEEAPTQLIAEVKAVSK